MENSLSIENSLKEWETIYLVHFGIKEDFSKILIPKQQQKPDFNQLIIVPQNLRLNQVISVLQKKFDCQFFTSDFDGTLVNDRQPKNSYSIWIRGCREADKQLKNLSANQLKEKGIAGITLLERLLWELFFFEKTGCHLDVKRWTLCAGSHCSDGSVPCVDWDSYRQKLRVSFCRPDFSSQEVCAREVIF